MVQWHFDNRGPLLRTRSSANGVYRESGSVMVRVPAFIGMSEDGRRAFQPQPLGELSGQPHKIEKGFFVGDAELGCPHAGDLACNQGRGQLALPRSRIIGAGGVAVVLRVLTVARRSSSHMNEQRVSEAAELGTKADRLVSGMGRDDHDPRPYPLAPLKLREDRLRRVHPSVPLGPAIDAATA